MGKAILIKFVLRILSLFPLRMAHAFGSAIGKSLLYFDNDLRYITFKNIELCYPNTSDLEKKSLCHDSLIETGKTMAELGSICYWSKNKLLRKIKKVSGSELLHQAKTFNRGVIIISPHLGCWEMAGLYCSNVYPMTILYKPPNIKELHEFVVKVRARAGGQLVPTNPTGIKKLYSTLKKGGVVGILPDQDPGRNNGIFAPFFSIQANTMTFVSRIAAKTQAKVVLVFAERLPHGQGYHMHFVQCSNDINAADLAVSVQALNRDVEACIRRKPDQYQWGYRRFRIRPIGEKSLYAKN